MEKSEKCSRPEDKMDEELNKVAGGYLPYVVCEHCGHHIRLKGWNDNICPKCSSTVKR